MYAFQAGLPLWRRIIVPVGQRCSSSRVHRAPATVVKRAPMLARQQVDSKGREYIRLDGFLKLQGLVDTGGEAKVRIQDGQIIVNGEVETRRGRKLLEGDVITVEDVSLAVDFVDGEEDVQSGDWK